MHNGTNRRCMQPLWILFVSAHCHFGIIISPHLLRKEPCRSSSVIPRHVTCSHMLVLHLALCWTANILNTVYAHVFDHTFSHLSLISLSLTPRSYNPCRFLADSRNRLQSSLSLALALQLLTPNFSASLVTSSIHLRFGLPARLLPSGLSKIIFLHGRLSCIRITCPAHLGLVILIVVTRSASSYKRYTVCFVMNDPILEPYISSTTNPKWMKLVPRERPWPRVSYDCR